MKAIGARLEIGFSVKAAVNGARWEGAFSELIVKPTVVSVYMRNNTGSCDRQVACLARDFERLDSLGLNLLVLSKDTVGSHLKYAAKNNAAFAFVSDPEHQFAKATDSLVEKKMYGRTFWGPTRSAYLIASDRRLLGVIEKVDPTRHADQVIDSFMRLAD